MTDKKWPIETLRGVYTAHRYMGYETLITRLKMAIAALKQITDFGRHSYCQEPNTPCEQCETVQIARDALNMKENETPAYTKIEDISTDCAHWVCSPCGETLTPAKALNHVCPGE